MVIEPTPDQQRNFELQTSSFQLEKEVERLRAVVKQHEVLLQRAMAIIADAIVHGMPITEEVAAVRNEIVCGRKQRTEVYPTDDRRRNQKPDAH